MFLSCAQDLSIPQREIQSESITIVPQPETNDEVNWDKPLPKKKKVKKNDRRR